MDSVLQWVIIKKDCEQDNECFNKTLRECKPVKIKENNLYEYRIIGSEGRRICNKMKGGHALKWEC